MKRIKIQTLLILLVLINSLELKPQETTGSAAIKKKGLMLQADDPEDAKRWAIVIGVNDYNDIALSKLTKARNDAKIVGQMLKEQGEFEKVFVMTDDLDAKDPLYPTKINIEEKLDNVLSIANQNDLILFFFSGHGVADPEGNGFVLPVDTVAEKVFYTTVSVTQIVSKMTSKHIKKSLLILDACRETISTSKGAAREGLQAERYANAEMSATFFSTKSGYYSFEDPKSDFGVFTKYLAYGMEGKADANNDGIVSFSELENFVQNGVSDWSIQNNKQQKPFVKYYREKYGDLPITIRAQREKSLVEENDYNKQESKIPALSRSAVLPGWGQIYSGGKDKGISYMAIWSFLSFNFLYRNQQYNIKKNDYFHTYGVPAVAGQGDSIGLNYMLIHPKRTEMVQSRNAMNLAGNLLASFWIWTLADLYLFKGNEFFWVFQTDVIPVENQFYSFGKTEPDRQAVLKMEFKF